MLLFTTATTLVCCAVPITLVALGFGAAVAAMVSAAPWLVTLSLHKVWVFSLSGLLIAGAVWAVYRPGRRCPADPELAAACARAQRWNGRFVVMAGAMWLLGLAAAYGLPLL